MYIISGADAERGGQEMPWRDSYPRHMTGTTRKTVGSKNALKIWKGGRVAAPWAPSKSAHEVDHFQVFISNLKENKSSLMMELLNSQRGEGSGSPDLKCQGRVNGSVHED